MNLQICNQHIINWTLNHSRGQESWRYKQSETPREKEGRGACECPGAERDEEARDFEAKEGEGSEK